MKVERNEFGELEGLEAHWRRPGHGANEANPARWNAPAAASRVGGVQPAASAAIS